MASAVTVRCRGCGEPRELTARSARRAGLCRTCLRPPKINVTDRERKWWLRQFSDWQLAVLATDLAGQSVSPTEFADRRVALLGSADPPQS